MLFDGLDCRLPELAWALGVFGVLRESGWSESDGDGMNDFLVLF